jgi:hypothetical protein
VGGWAAGGRVDGRTGGRMDGWIAFIALIMFGEEQAKRNSSLFNYLHNFDNSFLYCNISCRWTVLGGWCTGSDLGSNLDRDNGYGNWGFSWLYSVPPGKYRDSAWIRRRPLPSRSLPIRIPFDAIRMCRGHKIGHGRMEWQRFRLLN